MQPEKVYKNITIVARIYNAKTEELVDTKTRNIDDVSRRKWLQDLVMWAVMNGNLIEIVNEKDDTHEQESVGV